MPGFPTSPMNLLSLDHRDGVIVILRSRRFWIVGEHVGFHTTCELALTEFLVKGKRFGEDATVDSSRVLHPIPEINLPGEDLL
jgi:hypothetical protein